MFDPSLVSMYIPALPFGLGWNFPPVVLFTEELIVILIE